MTKNFLLFAVLLFILFGCISSRPPICEQTSSHIRPQTNVAENILGQEILWRQEDFPILVTISPNMREIRKQVVFEAIDTWNTEVGIEVFTYVIGPFNPNEGIVNITEEDLGPPDICGNQILGITTRYFNTNLLGYKTSMKRAEVKLHTGVSNRRVLGTAIHELGHVLGLNHDVDVNSIMYPYSLPNRGVITEEDINFVKRMIFRNTLPRNSVEYFL